MGGERGGDGGGGGGVMGDMGVSPLASSTWEGDGEGDGEGEGEGALFFCCMVGGALGALVMQLVSLVRGLSRTVPLPAGSYP